MALRLHSKSKDYSTIGLISGLSYLLISINLKKANTFKKPKTNLILLLMFIITMCYTNDNQLISAEIYSHASKFLEQD